MRIHTIVVAAVLSVTLVGCDLLNEEGPGTEREVRRAVVFGTVRTAAGEAVPDAVVTGDADPEGQCPAGDVLYLTSRLFRAVSDSRGTYRAVVEVDDPVERGCIRVWVRSGTRPLASTSGGPVRFAPTPTDSVRIDVVVAE